MILRVRVSMWLYHTHLSKSVAAECDDSTLGLTSWWSGSRTMQDDLISFVLIFMLQLFLPGFVISTLPCAMSTLMCFRTGRSRFRFEGNRNLKCTQMISLVRILVVRRTHENTYADLLKRVNNKVRIPYSRQSSNSSSRKKKRKRKTQNECCSV